MASVEEGIPYNALDGEPRSLFGHRDFLCLWLTNLLVFFANILVKMASLVWLFEATGSDMALGYVGVVQLVTQIPAILSGGVLADELDRRRVVSAMQAVGAVTCACLWLLGAAEALRPWHVYLSVALLGVSQRIDAPARNSLTPAVVPPALIPRATSTCVLTDNMSEVLAPVLFYAVTAGSNTSVGGSFVAAAIAYLLATVLPLLISTDGKDDTAGDSPRGDSPDAKSTSRVQRCRDGLVYIMGHPLLPGLYALDWGMTLFTFYRELFPVFAAASLFAGRPAWLTQRATVSLLTALNFGGGTVGSFVTFALASSPRRGRQVLLATVAYGAACVLFGASPLWWLCAAAVFLAGATDAVGMTVRKTVIAVETPPQMQGRASAGHSLAAQVANNLGQVYVAAACAGIGAGRTMVLGGVLTWICVAFAAWRIPALLTYTGKSS